jgi:hypothetical protein
MGVNVESDIAKALNDHLLALSNVWSVSFENVNFSPPASGRYLRVQLIPTNVGTPHVNGGPFYFTGIFQVSVVVPKGDGAINVTEESSRIIRHFAYLTEIVCPSGDILVNRYPQAAGGLVTDQTFEIPISINYELFST